MTTRKLMRNLPGLGAGVLLVLATLAPQGALAAERDRGESPSALAMSADALIARPVGAAITVVGAGLFVIGLPFSLIGGNVGESAETLVLGPAAATFVRCLGCTNTGRRPAARSERDDD